MASLRSLLQQVTKKNILRTSYIRRYPNLLSFSTENQKQDGTAKEKKETSSYEYKQKKDFLTYDEIIKQKEEAKRKTSPFRRIFWISSLALTAWASYDLTMAFSNYRLGTQDDEEKKFDLWKKYGVDVLSQVLNDKRLQATLGDKITLSDLKVRGNSSDWTALMFDRLSFKDTTSVRIKLLAYVSSCTLTAKLKGSQGTGEFILDAVSYDGTWAMKQVIIVKDGRLVLSIPDQVLSDPLGVPYYAAEKMLAGDKINKALLSQRSGKESK